jgi:hypothetical protein
MIESTGKQNYIRVLDFRNENGEFVFEFQPNTEDDIKISAYLVYIMIKRISSGLPNPDLIQEFYEDFMKQIMFYKVNNKNAIFTDLTIKFYIDYNGGSGAPVVSVRKYENRAEYLNEFTVINFQKKLDSLAFAYKARTDTGMYKASFLIYFLLLQSGLYASTEYVNDLYITFLDAFKEVNVKKPDQVIGCTVFTYFLDIKHGNGKPEIKAREE